MIYLLYLLVTGKEFERVNENFIDGSQCKIYSF